jgi:murein DD-endopeptidase MepM/ murein hydrolase activator NlpD
MVRQGQRVEVGESIGTIDPSIGHVHWEVRTEKTREPNPWQKTIDPIGWLENKQISHHFVSGKTPLRNGYPLNVGEKMAFEDPKKILDRQFQQWKSEAEASAQKVETGDNKSNWQSIALIGGGLALAYLMLKK